MVLWSETEAGVGMPAKASNPRAAFENRGKWDKELRARWQTLQKSWGEDKNYADGSRSEVLSGLLAGRGYVRVTRTKPEGKLVEVIEPSYQCWPDTSTRAGRRQVVGERARHTSCDGVEPLRRDATRSPVHRNHLDSSGREPDVQNRREVRHPDDVRDHRTNVAKIPGPM